MPFAPADIYSATVVDHEQSESRLDSRSATSSPIKRLHSSHIFFVAFLLYLATGVQMYLQKNTAGVPPTAEMTTDVFISFSREIAYVLSDILSPLMILACTVTMVGTLCRGAEMVIRASSFAGKL
ncbi:hypothetical protein CPB86DRAFT_789896 [Serendipita vermifera]|nr:hypothetical protein CPB86DRAFT_789896 [Serendipita vermifera]